MLIFIETQVEIHSTIKKFKTRHGQSNITYIDIPKDTSMDWNEILKKLPQEAWKRTENPVLVEKYIIECNKRHVNQAQGTPCTIEPLTILLGLCSRTLFGNSILESSRCCCYCFRYCYYCCCFWVVIPAVAVITDVGVPAIAVIIIVVVVNDSFIKSHKRDNMNKKRRRIITNDK